MLADCAAGESGPGTGDGDRPVNLPLAHSVSVAALGATLGLLAALLNGTSPFGGLVGGLLVGELVALLTSGDADGGGITEEASSEGEPVSLTPLPTHG